MVDALSQTGQNQSGKLLPLDAMEAGVTFWIVVIALAVAVGVVLAIRQAIQDTAEKQVGVQRFAGFVLRGSRISVGASAYDVTPDTHAEVVGAVQEGRRPTATRTVVGGAVAGPVGAIVGHAAQKKTRSSSALLVVNGDDWTHSVEIDPTGYSDAVRFAQAVNLAARTSKRADQNL